MIDGQATRRRRWHAALPVAVLSLALLATPSSAIVANPAPRLCAAFSSADVVVAGRVGGARTGSEWVSWEVTADRFYKGQAPRTFRVFSPNDSARGTPDAGQRNMLFIARRGDRLLIAGSDPNVGGAAMRAIEDDVKALAARSGRGAGSIKLLIASGQGEPFKHAHVRLRRAGAARDVLVRADAHGRATVSAAPGRWTAEIAEPGWGSRFSLYSYNRADGFTLAPGGCADLRLEPLRLRSRAKA